MKLKLAQMWDHNGTNMEVCLSCSCKCMLPCYCFASFVCTSKSACLSTSGAHELVVQAIGFMYRNYKVLVSLDAKEDVVGKSPVKFNPLLHITSTSSNGRHMIKRWQLILWKSLSRTHVCVCEHHWGRLRKNSPWMVHAHYNSIRGHLDRVWF